MSRSALVRAGGISAIIGGVLRAAASFAPNLGSDAEQQVLYLTVDVFLILGLLGFFELQHEDVGWIGTFGFLLALIGLVVVRSSRAISGVDLYPAGAFAVAGGLIVLTASASTAKTLKAWIPVTLLVSTLLGLVGTVLADAAWLLVVSGLTFGAAFAGLGRGMWVAARQI